MAKQQKRQVVPPIVGDQGTLNDFSSIVQDNFKQLFDLAHTHEVRSTVPAYNEGQVGDIVLVFISPTYYVYAKVTTQMWLRVALS